MKKIYGEIAETEARWERYEAINLTSPKYQRKMEEKALAAEERQLNERKQELEAKLKSRITDCDFFVRHARLQLCLAAKSNWQSS